VFAILVLFPHNHKNQFLILQARLNVGDIVTCTIKRFVYFGIFVEVDLTLELDEFFFKFSS
jgi:ribosomal protein S1